MQGAKNFYPRGGKEFDIGAILFSLWRRKWVFLVSFAVFSAITIVFHLPKMKGKKERIYYEAESEIIFKKFSYIPVIMEKFGLDVDEVSPDLNFEQRIIRSTEVGEIVFEKLWNEGFFFSHHAGRFQVDESEIYQKDESAREELKRRFIHYLLRNIRTYKFSDDEIGLKIKVIWDTREGAIKVVNAVAESYREHLSQRFRGEVHKALYMMEEALGHLEDLLSESYRSFAKFTSEKGIIDLRLQTKMIFDTLKSLREKLYQIETRKKMMRELLETISANQSINIYDFLPVSGVFQNLYSEYNELQMRKIELLNIYTEKHPKVKAINKKISFVRKRLREKIIIELKKLDMEREIVIREMSRVKKEIEDISELAIEYIRRKNKLELINSLFYDYYQGFLNATLLGGIKFSLISDVKLAGFAREVNPIRRKLGTLIVLSIVVGFVAGLISVFISEGIDMRFSDISEIEESFSIPILGLLPEAKTKEDKAIFDEAIKGIRINTELIAMQRKLIIGVFSSDSGEGKTRISTELAKAFASAGRKTCIVDLNIRHPEVHKMLGIENSKGVVDVVAYDIEVDEVVRKVDDELFVITAGMRHPSPPDLLSSAKMRSFLDALRRRFDVVIFDSAPVLPVPDILPCSRYADFGIFVLNMKKTAKMQAMRAKAVLEQSKANVKGIVVNFVSKSVSPYIKYYVAKYDY